MRRWIVPVLLSALAAAPAWGQGAKPAQPSPAQKPATEKPAGEKPAPQNPSAAKPGTITGSPLAGVAFADQPYPLADDGTYQEFMGQVAQEAGRSCGRLEAFGWDFAGLTPEQAQDRMDRILQSTMRAFKDAGFAIAEAKSQTVAERGLAAYTTDKDARKLLLMWAPLPDSAILLICGEKG